MKVTNEKTENRQAYLRIEMEPAEIEVGTENCYRKLVKRVNVPGFRRGKAPRLIFERHFGKHELFHETLDDLIPDAYNKVIAEQKLEPIAQPTIQLVEEEPAVIFTAVVPLKPTVTPGDYHSIDLKPEPVTVTEEMVEKVVDRLRHQHATWEPVERAIELSDVVTLDVESTLLGEPLINQKGIQYQVVKDSLSPAPGFAEQLVGLKKGEEKQFTIKYPEDYAQNNVAGKEAIFKVKITETKQEKLPEINDEFAVQVGAEYTSVAVLRDKVREDLQKRTDEQINRDFEDRVIDAATAMSKVEYPPVMVVAETDHLIEREFRFLQHSGQDIEQYLKSINKTVDQIRQDLQPTAVKSVTQSLVLGKIAEQEKVEVTPAEVDAEIEGIVKNSTGDKAVLKRTLNDPRNRRSIEDTLITRKAVQRLVEIARTPKLIKP